MSDVINTWPNVIQFNLCELQFGGRNTLVLFFNDKGVGYGFFGQRLGAGHSKPWSKMIFFTFLYEKCKKGRKERKTKQNQSKNVFLGVPFFSGLHPNAGQKFYSQKKHVCYYALIQMTLDQHLYARQIHVFYLIFTSFFLFYIFQVKSIKEHFLTSFCFGVGRSNPGQNTQHFISSVGTGVFNFDYCFPVT